MDKINSNDLLVKILSFLPTKDAVTTSVLSKRWKSLWMWVPNLEYDDHTTKPSNRGRQRLRRFIKRTLPLHRAPILESLCLKLSALPSQPEDIKQLVEAAVSLCVREISIAYYTYRIRSKNTTLPICLFTSKSLVSLTLNLNCTVVFDVPRFACLPSLKSLHLQDVRYTDESFRPLGDSHTVCFPSLKSLYLIDVIFFDKESLGLLLANCPDLEDLAMVRHGDYDNLGFVSIVVPSLKNLLLYIDSECSSHGVEIVTPSLEYIKLEDHCNHHFLIENMPELEEAEIHADILDDSEKFLGPFSSVKRLTLRLNLKRTEAKNVAALFFNQLESLKIYSCSPYWSILLLRLLKGSPKLKVLDLYNDTIALSFKAPLVCWDQLTYVPECLLTRLETFTWTSLQQSKEARDVVAYIKKNSCRLKPETVDGTWCFLGCMYPCIIRGDEVIEI
ncbi:unnamed protein product [Microthlaspi erraticum]|uniref:F-box domain-containing protein n=1 Tax=Microthlaspi erraticum TaxID=1685480 RepID=A0A6D2J7R4_9BRAS|nr:unnamed protein product [Microthlaspi erraticum]